MFFIQEFARSFAHIGYKLPLVMAANGPQLFVGDSFNRSPDLGIIQMIFPTGVEITVK